MIDFSALQAYTPKRRREFDRDVEFLIRPSSSDTKAIDEVFARNAYRRYGLAIEPGDCWLDLGANVGAFSVLCRLKGATALGFEAEATNAAIAAENLRRNDLEPAIRHAAIVADGHAGETATLHTNTAPLSLRRHSTVISRRASSPIEVPAQPFAGLAALGDCLKINIEGAEVSILAGLPDLRPFRKVAIEWSFDAEPRLAILRLVLDHLESQFKTVRTGRANLPWHLEKYPYYPPSTYIYCF